MATIRDDTWNVLNMQNITPNPKLLDYLDIPGGVTFKIQTKCSMNLIQHSH